MQYSSEKLLTVKDLSVRFGGIIALDSVNFDIKQGSITALIGPNGAGKTTVFNCLTGFYRATKGLLEFEGKKKKVNISQLLGEKYTFEDIYNVKSFLTRTFYKMFGGSHQVAKSGLARTFQNIRLFSDMTVIENLLVAQHLAANKNILSGLFNFRSFKQAEDQMIEKAFQWLKIVGLDQYANHIASELPYGHQRRLEIARAMCTNPKLICLDEPAAGLNPNETKDLAKLIRLLRDQYHTTVFVIEHDMSLVMEISDEIIVLNYGKVIAKGIPSQIKNDPIVLAAYLGSED